MPSRGIAHPEFQAPFDLVVRLSPCAGTQSRLLSASDSGWLHPGRAAVESNGTRFRQLSSAFALRPDWSARPGWRTMAHPLSPPVFKPLPIDMAGTMGA